MEANSPFLRWKAPITQRLEWEGRIALQPFKKLNYSPCSTAGMRMKKSNIPAVGYSESASKLDSYSMIETEIKKCKDLIEVIGYGAVFIGSSRIPEDHEFFVLTRELSFRIAELLQIPIWSGIGPGLMEAAAQGAAQANLPAAGFKILMESNQKVASWKHPHLPESAYITCESIAARKIGFLEAARRKTEDTRTVFVGLPGGIGTLDEMFEILALIQLRKLDSEFPAPFLIMNYNGCFDGLLSFVQSLESFGGVREGEFEGLCHVCLSNDEAVEYLREYYKL